MKGRAKPNEYCETCGKFHKPGKHIPKVIGDAVKGDVNAIISIMRRATRNMYLSRDLIGDANEFKESDIVKEVKDDDEGESGGNKKENK